VKKNAVILSEVESLPEQSRRGPAFVFALAFLSVIPEGNLLLSLAPTE